jgi:hypothetical protein
LTISQLRPTLSQRRNNETGRHLFRRTRIESAIRIAGADLEAEAKKEESQKIIDSLTHL